MLRLILLCALAALGCEEEGSATPSDAREVSVVVDVGLEDAAVEVDTAVEVDAVVEVDAAPLPEGFEPAVIPLDGQVLLPAQLDGAEALLVVDTGAMRTSLEETRLRGVENGVGRADLTLGAYELPDFAALAADFSEARAYIGPLDGVIGQDLFERFDFGLDYRREAIRVSEETIPTPPGFGAPFELPYEIIQGLPIVRLGTPTGEAALIADTGSGVTLLTESAAGALPLERLGGYAWHTRYGTDMSTIAYLPLTVAGREVISWVVIIPDDYHLREIFEALGLEVEGILGYPLFRQFFVHIEGRQGRFRLAPDASDPAPAGEWTRVGVELKLTEGRVEIDMVFEPSHAHTIGLRPGDVIEAIDGEVVEGLNLDAVRRRLRGEAGRAVTLRLGDGRDVEVQVERLL